MKYLGIDYGTKRIGLAISDNEGFLARPLSVIKNSEHIIQDIKKIIEDERIEVIVVGKSLNQDGDENKLEQEIQEFIGTLTMATFLPIERVNESFSSFEAHTRQGKESRIARQSKKEKTPDLDAKAAAVILQRFLDSNK